MGRAPTTSPSSKVVTVDVITPISYGVLVLPLVLHSISGHDLSVAYVVPAALGTLNSRIPAAVPPSITQDMPDPG